MAIYDINNQNTNYIYYTVEEKHLSASEYITEKSVINIS
jgi:hypothetical protein